MQDFKDKVAVVTGAASGIGRGLAERFAADGMRVVLADVEQSALDTAAAEMTNSGATVLAVRTDVSKPEQVDALAQQTIDRFGAVHVLCNNAGVGSGGFAWEQSLDDWRWVVDVNLWGVIHGVRAFVPVMLAHGEEGHIVNTASMAGLLAGPRMSAYNVTKFAVVALSETLHHDLAAASGGKIGVSVLCPGVVATNIVDSARNRPYGRLPAPAPGSPEAAARDAFRSVLAAGMPPSEVAQHVFDAIRERRFYVLTHPEYTTAVRARADAIVNGGTPPPPGFV